MFYGSQSSTGPAVALITESRGTTSSSGSYWNANDFTIRYLRPNPSLYVPELDLTGGPGTGLSSPNVMAAVNLLRSSNVEGYRDNIYSDNEQGRGDGVPTVGNGLALVVRGSGGVWQVRPEHEIRDLLRDAGLPESRYSELPLDQLQQSANLLNQGNLAGARAVFGTGRDGNFSVTQAEADQLTGAFVVRNVVPTILRRFDDAETLALMEPGEFAAVASRVYQSPGWLDTANGQRFIDAWWDDDTAAAQAALGTNPRNQAEAQAYAGNVSTTNPNLVNLHNGASLAADSTNSQNLYVPNYDQLTTDMQGTLPGSGDDLELITTTSTPPATPNSPANTGPQPAGSTVPAIVLEQNRAGNPITAEDIRTANPELNLNADLSNVPTGVMLVMPTRVGEHLVTSLPDGGTQSVNTRSQEITTVVTNANGTTTQTTSSTDGEFTRTVRTITYDRNGEITSESRHSLNTLDGTRTEIPLSPAPSPTTSTDSEAPTPAVAPASTSAPEPAAAPVETPLTDEQISFLQGNNNATPTPAPEPILVADAGSHTGGGTVSDAGGGLGGFNTVGAATNVPPASAPSGAPSAAPTSTPANTPTSPTTPSWLSDLQHNSPDFAARLTPDQINTINNSPLAQQQIEGYLGDGGSFTNGQAGSGSDYSNNAGQPVIRIDSNVTGNDFLRVLSHELGHANSELTGGSANSAAGNSWQSLREVGVAIFNEYQWNRNLIDSGQPGFSMSAGQGQYQQISDYIGSSAADPGTGSFGGAHGDVRNAVINQIAVWVGNQTPSTDLATTYFNQNFEHFMAFDPSSPLSGASNITRFVDDDGNILFSGVRPDGTPIAVSQPRISQAQFSFDDDGNVLIIGTRTDGSTVAFSTTANGTPSNATLTAPGGSSAPLAESLQPTTPVSASNPPLPVTEPAPSAPEIIVNTAPANDFSLNNFLGGAGSGLTPAQQTALANQLDGMGLGGADDLQFFPLPGGGALIQNADGDIVGEIAPRTDGTLSISGNTVNTDGSSGQISNSIDAGGTVQTTAQYTQAQIAQMSQLQGGLGLVNGLLNLENFEDLSSLGQIAVRIIGQSNRYEINSDLRSIRDGYVPISFTRSPEKAAFRKAANDSTWRLQA